jgi:hypothetical protein
VVTRGIGAVRLSSAGDGGGWAVNSTKHTCDLSPGIGTHPAFAYPGTRRYPAEIIRLLALLVMGKREPGVWVSLDSSSLPWRGVGYCGKVNVSLLV